MYDTLLDMLAFGGMAAEIVSHGKTAYDRERTLRLAAEAVAHKIGEAVARLTDQNSRTERELAFVRDHPQIPWRVMKRMRNIVAHNYGAIDYEILWNALERNVPGDMATIAAILDQPPPAGPEVS